MRERLKASDKQFYLMKHIACQRGMRYGVYVFPFDTLESRSVSKG